jgi:hypothetical protein
MRSNWSPICLLVIEQSNYYKKFDNNKKKNHGSNPWWNVRESTLLRCTIKELYI